MSKLKLQFSPGIGIAIGIADLSVSNRARGIKSAVRRSGSNMQKDETGEALEAEGDLSYRINERSPRLEHRSETDPLQSHSSPSELSALTLSTRQTSYFSQLSVAD